MSIEQFNAEMIMLHTNHQNSAAKAKQRFKFFQEKANELLIKAGTVDKMSEAQKRNYEMMMETANEVEAQINASSALIIRLSDLNQQINLGSNEAWEFVTNQEFIRDVAYKVIDDMNVRFKEYIENRKLNN